MTNRISISFYQTKDEKIKVKKKLVTVGTDFIGTIHSEYTYPTVVIALSAKSINFEINTANYAELNGLLNGYYFLQSYEFISGILYVTLQKDVLMTYADKILATTAIIERNENDFNFYLRDDSMMAKAYPQVQIKEFPNGFDGNATYILVTAGK